MDRNRGRDRDRNRGKRRGRGERCRVETTRGFIIIWEDSESAERKPMDIRCVLVKT